MTPREVLDRLLARQDLGEGDARDLLGLLTSDDVDPALKAGLLVALRAKGETADEVRGLALGMRAAARRLDAGRCVDTCGTGGDSSHSFNVSTATALLCAAGGLRVAKHGNRSVSSRSGSADVLEAMGVKLPDGPEAAVDRLARLGFTFLFAPTFHPAMKAVVPVRRSLGTRTVFNILGPLTNPAAPPWQLIGAFDPQVGALMADTLAGLPIERVFVVHGTPAWDEATPMGPFELWDVRPGRVERRMVDPLSYGIPRCEPRDLAGGDAAENAARMAELLRGRLHGPIRDAVLLNTALVLEVTGREAGRAATALAASWLDDGAAGRFLDRLLE